MAWWPKGGVHGGEVCGMVAQSVVAQGGLHGGLRGECMVAKFVAWLLKWDCMVAQSVVAQGGLHGCSSGFAWWQSLWHGGLRGIG